MSSLQRDKRDRHKKILPKLSRFRGGDGENSQKIATLHSRALAKSQNRRTK